jgi:hypothetical protein
MISDVLHQALAAIGEYMDAAPEAYRGELRDMLDDLADHMNDVMMVLDTPPGTEGENCGGEQNAKVKTKWKTA